MAGAAPPGAAIDDGQTGARVLLVDDEPAIARF